MLRWALLPGAAGSSLRKRFALSGRLLWADASPAFLPVLLSAGEEEARGQPAEQAETPAQQPGGARVQVPVRLLALAPAERPPALPFRPSGVLTSGIPEGRARQALLLPQGR